MSFLRLVRHLFRRRHLEEDLDQEIRSHQDGRPQLFVRAEDWGYRSLS